VTVRSSSFFAALARLVCAPLAGYALSAAFPPRGWGWLAPIAIMVFTVCLWRRSAWSGFLLGALFGLALFLPLISWMRVVGDDAWVMLSLLCAFWAAVTGALIALVTRLPLWPLWAATCWVAVETLRDRIPWGGFAWGRLAFSQSDSPFAFLAAIAGAPLVTFTVALLGSLLAAGVLHLAPGLAGEPRWGARPVRSPGLAAVDLVLIVAILLGGLASSAVTVLPQPGTEKAVTAAVIQGNVPRAGLGTEGPPGQILDNNIAATRELARLVRQGSQPQPELVIWPENASDIDPYTHPGAAFDISSTVDDIGAPVLVGAVVANPDNPDTVLNLGIVWKPGTGPGEWYAKRHPVPFGEYIPMRPLISRLIDRFALIPRDFAAGHVPGVLTLGPARIGDVICFEVADDEVVRDAITGGGHVLVVQTNNATYGRTGQPEQQLAITRLRAIEHGRATLVAATSGISAIMTARGDITAQLPEFVAGSLVSEVVQSDSLTPSDRLGSKPEWALTLIALLAVLWALMSRRLGSNERGRAGGRPSDDFAQEN